MGIFFFAVLLQIGIMISPSVLEASTTFVSLKNGDSAVLIGKNDGRLKIVKREKKDYSDISEFFISYGQKDGSKAKEGDNKTPEGIYFATGIKTKQDLNNLPEELYGTYAVPLNYPNPVDQKLGSSGYGIWLHGTDSEEKLSGKNITKGCIIMENTNINQLVKYIRVMKTPVIVSSSLKDITLEKNDTDKTYLVFNSASEKYKVTVQDIDGLEKNTKVLYEEIK
jgi:murein L,D-transpeptidase YafK